MAGGDSNKKQVTTVNNNDPWDASKGYLKGGMKLANQYLGDEVGFKPYEGDTVVPHSEQTTAALGGLESFANNAMTGGYGASLDQIMNNGGFNTQQSEAMEAYKKAMDGDYNVDSSAFKDLSSSELNLANMASGGMMGMNPQIQDMLDQVQRRVGDRADLSASASGRYGSGLHQENLSRGIADATGSLLFNQYNTDVRNMMGANTAIDGAKMQRLGAAAGIDAGNMDRMMGGADSLWQAGQMGLGNMSNAFQASMLPYQALHGVGQAHEDLAGRYMQDDIRRWEGNEAAEWNRLTNAMAVFGGAGGLGGNSTTTVQQPQVSPWAQLGGGAMAGYGMTGSPWGAAIGAATAIPSFF
jgi:hypothetical protein